MAFTIASLARNPGDSVLYDPKFRTVIETHLPILRQPPSARIQSISPDKIHQYEADFYGLLNELNIPLELHWVYLRVNGFHNPNEFGRQAHDPYVRLIRFDLIHPSVDAVSELRMLFISTQR